MRKITQAQIRKIHALSRELGMDDDLLHEFTSMVTGKDSIRELSVMDAVRLIDSMETKKGYERGDRISWRQEQYIFVLMRKLGWTDKGGEPDLKRLNGFVKKQYGTEDYRWTTKKTAGRVIEGLKALLGRQ